MGYIVGIAGFVGGLYLILTSQERYGKAKTSHDLEGVENANNRFWIGMIVLFAGPFIAMYLGLE